MKKSPIQYEVVPFPPNTPLGDFPPEVERENGVTSITAMSRDIPMVRQALGRHGIDVINEEVIVTKTRVTMGRKKVVVVHVPDLARLEIAESDLSKVQFAIEDISKSVRPNPRPKPKS